jgi:hypothetical protein
MSMYTHLLDAACGQRAPALVRPNEHSARNAERRCRGDLAKDAPPATPAVLAREIGYDVALLELAEALGIAL